MPLNISKKIPFKILITSITFAVFLTIILLFIYSNHSSEDLNQNSRSNIKKISNFEFVNTKGDKISLSNFQNQVIILSFWASWCAPCLSELPIFSELEKQWGKHGLKIIPVNLDDEFPQTFIEEFWKEHQLTFETYLDPERIAVRDLKVSVLPTNFVISREGEIVLTGEGFTDWTSQPTKEFLKLLLTESSSNEDKSL